MISKHFSIVLFFSVPLVLCTIFYSCANQIALTGGPRDTEPPQLDTLTSSANYQLHYVKSEMELNFDEFITLKSPGQQIIISPPLQYPLDIDQRLKRIRMNFDDGEILKEDATYIINFGEAITDFTEGNVLNNFSFVFSTGDFIDSLSLTGKVLDAKSKEPVENITVMLYDNLYDSVVYLERPFYFAKTEEDSTFHLKNLREDTFKIVALDDLNLNYLYEDNAEKFAFLLNNIVLNDSSEYDLTLLSFKLKTTPRYLDNAVVNDGQISFSFDQELEANPAFPVRGTAEWYSEIDGTRALYWLKNFNNFPYSFAVKADSILDTISVRRPQSKDRIPLPLLKISKSNVNSESGLHHTDTLQVEFNLPLDSLNENLITIVEDSLPIKSRNVYLDSTVTRTLNVAVKWKEGKDYILIMDSSSIIDYYGNAIDSTAYKFTVGRRNAFGDIDLTLRNVNDSLSYVIELKDEDEVIRTWMGITSSIDQLLIPKLPPATYSLTITEDYNANGIWDPGNYLENRYSEKIFEVQLEPLKENWTLEALIDFSTLGKNE